MGIVLGFVIALIVPLLFLSIIYESDFYQTGQFHTILKCLFWGGVTFAPATFTYIALEHFWLKNPDTIVQFAAPFYEEVFKGFILLYLFKRAKFTYSVDGALYGFAIGTGFAIIENFVYISSDLPEATMVATQRIFSANLVHAFSTATIGITLGLFRSRTSRLRWQIPAVGLFIAIAQHMLYNNIIHMIDTPGNRVFPGIIFVPGLPGILFIRYVMQYGKKQAQIWIKEKLRREKRITQNEIRAVDRLADMDDILLPIVERFGAETASQVEKLLYLQAHIGIKNKALDGLRGNDTIYKAVEAEINEMHTRMKKVQNEIGVYPMLFVRGLFTDEMASVWEQMQSKIEDRSAATGNKKGGGLWSSLEERIKSSTANGRLK
jgi:RsiW-degrading membrane proteinase PrsW (M82 family)